MSYLDLIEISLFNGQYPKPTNKGSYCKGYDVNVKVNGYQKGGNGELVSCVVEKKTDVRKGTTVKWNGGGGFQSGLKSCSDIVFDLTQGRLPTVQVMTDQNRSYCPHSVKLEIIEINNQQITKRIICAEMENGYYKKWYNQGRNNDKIHETTEGNCQ